MVTTADPELAERLALLRTHGITRNADELIENHGGWYHEMQLLGYNYRITDFQSALGISQLSRADEGLKRRREIAEIYTKSFAGSVVRTLQVNENSKHAYHLYTIQIDRTRTNVTRDQFLDAMTKENIGVGVHYLSIPEHPYYQQTFGWKTEDCPNAALIGQQTVSLPISPKLTSKDIEDVALAVRRSLGC